MRFQRLAVSSLAALMLIASGSASALQNFTGKVTGIELSYMPNTIRFSMDQGNAACPAGTALTWANANIDNNKAVLAALTTAFANGHRITFYINDNDTSCVGRFLYLAP